MGLPLADRGAYRPPTYWLAHGHDVRLHALRLEGPEGGAAAPEAALHLVGDAQHAGGTELRVQVLRGAGGWEGQGGRTRGKGLRL